MSPDDSNIKPASIGRTTTRVVMYYIKEYNIILFDYIELMCMNKPPHQRRQLQISNTFLALNRLQHDCPPLEVVTAELVD